VLGYLIGKISGKPFEVFLKERILDPLGMVDTGCPRRTNSVASTGGSASPKPDTHELCR